MLKKISVSELRLGMHLHELCGSWLDHPFWKTKFVLRDPADLEKLRSSGVAECWIDASKGLDVEAAAAPEARPLDTPKVETVPMPRPAAKPEAASAGRAELREELERAGALIKQSRRAVMSLFSEARMGKAMDAEGCAALVDDIASSVT
ncbi:MAG: DUF3391 domain-containing protein, partial [Proteobacteria bacterium]|nr:DUF3391 domain-containing protein [Pseudomonadota bacterium]